MLAAQLSTVIIGDSVSNTVLVIVSPKSADTIGILIEQSSVYIFLFSMINLICGRFDDG